MRLPVAALAFVLVIEAGGAVASQQWQTQQDPEFGFRFSYPKNIFQAEKFEPPSFHYFASASHEAKFVVGAWENSDGQTPEELKRWMLANGKAYDDITYEPRGRSWFVVSGYRGERIFYQKVVFSCRGRVANLMGISYAVADRRTFDPVVERMEDDFKPGRACPS